MLTMKEVMERFNVNSSRTIVKFMNQGLKCFKIGQRDYRFREEDVEDFIEQKIQLEQQKTIQIYPIKKKTRCKTVNIDYEKLRINKELNRVI